MEQFGQASTPVGNVDLSGMLQGAIEAESVANDSYENDRALDPYKPDKVWEGLREKAEEVLDLKGQPTHEEPLNTKIELMIDYLYNDRGVQSMDRAIVEILNLFNTTDMRGVQGKVGLIEAVTKRILDERKIAGVLARNEFYQRTGIR